jgi:type VI secretion system protein ImpF
MARYPHVADSVLNFGIPPVAGRYLSEVRWDDIEKNIRKAVLRFEPRIIPDSLSVVPPVDIGKQRTGNTLRFLIQGMIHMDPHPLEFVMQSYLDLETSTFGEDRPKD